ncbi:hypothetical protein ACH0CA_08035 [Kytococcus sedentarius]|uniref:hypothetical protein n=1 Tax=Kytococcus sedentarius TaxID=1276 RepID=UPI003879E1C5
MRHLFRRHNWVLAAAGSVLVAACSGADEAPQTHGESSASAPASQLGTQELSAQGGAEGASPASEVGAEPMILDCLGEGSMVRPETLSLDCQETNATLSKLQWSQWDTEGAKGSGEFSVNNCVPNCAEGTVETYQVDVQAPDVKTSEAGSVYTSITVNFHDGRPVGSTSRETYELPH